MEVRGGCASRVAVGLLKIREKKTTHQKNERLEQALHHEDVQNVQ